MAIQSLTDLKALINSTIQDNTTNDISGSDVQTALINAIDTLDSLEGFINVHKANGQTTITAYGSKALARAAVPDDCKKEGVVIAYKISTGWLIEQNLDATAGTWGDDASWQTIGPVSVSQNSQTGKTELKIGDTPALIVDNEPEVGSDNLVKSGGVHKQIVGLGYKIGLTPLVIENAEAYHDYTLEIPIVSGTKVAQYPSFYANFGTAEQFYVVGGSTTTAFEKDIISVRPIESGDFTIVFESLYIKNTQGSVQYDNIADSAIKNNKIHPQANINYTKFDKGTCEFLMASGDYSLFTKTFTGTFAAYTHISWYLKFKAGTTFINRGVPVILSTDDQATVNRHDIETGQSYTTPIDVMYIKARADGSVNLEVSGYLDKYVGTIAQIPFNSFKNSGTLSANQSLTTDSVQITKDFLLSAIIGGNSDSVKIGLGNGEAEGILFEVTPTNLIILTGSGTQITSIAHNINLGTRYGFYIERNVDTNCKIKIIGQDGGLFSDTFNMGWFKGQPIIINNGAASINATFSFMPRDLEKSIWMFGDSYFSYGDNQRWVYYLINWGYTNNLINAKSGEASTEALSNLQNLFKSGSKPKYLLWCLGMNDAADNGSVDETWKSCIDSVVELCLDKGIIPILATIPSIPTKNHGYKNSYIRSLGYRYIDFSAAVNIDDNGNWVEGTLSNDGIHPTEKGALLLAMQALVDMPELSACE